MSSLKHTIKIHIKYFDNKLKFAEPCYTLIYTVLFNKDLEDIKSKLIDYIKAYNGQQIKDTGDAFKFLIAMPENINLKLRRATNNEAWSIGSNLHSCTVTFYDDKPAEIDINEYLY